MAAERRAVAMHACSRVRHLPHHRRCLALRAGRSCGRACTHSQRNQPAAQAASGLGIVQWLFSTRPQTDATLTYAQMLEYLQNKRATRLLVYDDGKKATSVLLSPPCFALRVFEIATVHRSLP